MSTREPLRLIVESAKKWTDYWQNMRTAYETKRFITDLFELEWYLSEYNSNCNAYAANMPFKFLAEYLSDEQAPLGKYAPPIPKGRFKVGSLKLEFYQNLVFDNRHKEDGYSTTPTEGKYPKPNEVYEYKYLESYKVELSRHTAQNECSIFFAYWCKALYNKSQAEYWDTDEWDEKKRSFYPEFLQAIVDYDLDKPPLDTFGRNVLPFLRPRMLYTESYFFLQLCHKQLAEHYLKEWEAANNGQEPFEQDYKPTVREMAEALRNLKDKGQLPENLKDLSNGKLAKKVSGIFNCSPNSLRQQMSTKDDPTKDALAWVKAQLEIK